MLEIQGDLNTLVMSRMLTYSPRKLGKCCWEYRES